MPFDFDATASLMSDDTGDKLPNLMPDALIFDARRLHACGSERREQLAGTRPFDIKNLDDIPPLCDVLYQSQKSYVAAQADKVNASSKPVRDESTELLTSVMRIARYYYRADPDAQSELDQIGDIGAVHDRYGDLIRIADFCTAHPEMLADEPRIPANVADRARELAAMLATIPDNSVTKSALRRRNLAFWMLSKAVTEVRGAIRHKFADDPDYLERASERYEPPKKRSKTETPAGFQK